MKKKLPIIIAVIVAILIIGGVVAYLTDTDSKRNVFTVGSVKISLSEDNWDEFSGQSVMPGQTVQKDPTIENIGKNSAYVYIKVEQPIVNLTSGEGPLFSYTTNSGWNVLGDNSSSNCPILSTVYYYNTELAKDTSTNSLFDEVTLNNYNQSSAIGNKNIVITGYAIQSNYLPSRTTIQSAYNTYFDNSGIGECNRSTIYRWSRNHVYIGDNISLLTLGTDYVTDKSQVINMDARASKYFLKHEITNNIVTKSFICFNITPELAAANPGLTVGEYCIDGAPGNTTYEANKEILLSAFSSTYCTEYTEPEKSFNCWVNGLDARNIYDRYIHVGGGGDSGYCCDINNGINYAYSSQSDCRYRD